MRTYGTNWKGNSQDKTGLASFVCRDKEVLFKMDSFEEYLELCGVIDNAINKAEGQLQYSIFTHMNSYKKD